MTVKEYLWKWDQQTFSVTYETLGQGSPVLLLPAFSTVSSRSKVQEIADRLAAEVAELILPFLGR